MFKQFPFFRQLESTDCGAACLRMISKFYGKNYSLRFLRNECSVDSTGASLKGISDGAEAIGLRVNGVKISYQGTEEEAGILDVTLPCIAYWRQRHFVVVYKVGKKFVWVADPALGKKKYSRKEFEKGWYLKNDTGILLLFEPSPSFYEYELQEAKQRNLSYLYKYLIPYKKLFIQLGLGLLLGSIFSLMLPFLTQAIVDVGIANQDIDFHLSHLARPNCVIY